MRGEEEVAVGPRLYERSKWIQLLTTVDLAEFFATSGFGFDIGFSVDRNGHNGVNLTNVRYDLSDDGQAHVLVWSIQIAEGVVDTVLRPTSASLTVTGDYIAWSNLRGILRVPNGAQLSQGVVWGDPENTNNPTRPEGVTEFRWPIHSYYDGDTIVLYWANFEWIEQTQNIPPDPVGATADDVWMADGVNYYPYLDSFPVSGTGRFSLAINRYNRSVLWFEGPEGAVIPEKDPPYSETDSGYQDFELHGEGTTTLHGMGTGSGVSDGGALTSAHRYRKSASSGGSHSTSVAAWLPNGDRESILFMKRNTDITPPYIFTHRVRGLHEIGASVYQITPCSYTEGGVTTYIHMKLKDSPIQEFPQLPARCDGAGVYGDYSWKSAGELPAGPCKTYGTDWVVSAKASNLPSDFWYDEQLETIDSTTTVHTTIYVNCPGDNSLHDITFDENLEDPNAYPKLEYIWADVPTSEGIPQYPLYVNRTYRGNGIFWDAPGQNHIQKLNVCDSVYLAMLADRGIAIWVGEPET